MAVFVELYRRVSTKPATAHKNRTGGEAKGAFIDFLEIALGPLGFEGDRMAILRLVEAMKKQPPSPIVWIGRRENQ